ncbi:serine/threonine protein kinase [Calycomorphotria hydatis]|uniref:Serine/threonine-protein kinase PrkC n=1 Tax=Calycomorphotria hydatis TaxID=2528027 RepID=A0A517TC28_9PLAN|nr:serine/threonine-protein kinase [Calycomorphotria hydatis]QDT65929.1 Serine/threonine-protein kinase PrkC [Calycomorphotria hydatis]
MATKLAADSLITCIRKSGLVNDTSLDSALEGLSESGIDANDSSQIAKELIGKSLLTKWQAEKLLQGRHRGFFLGKYKLLSLLGKGGMSAVYLAEHSVMKRQCAIKVLPSKRVDDSSYLGRFHREAQAVASLDHPNIVRAYDVDCEKDKETEIHFLVMEYVRGNSLHEAVQEIGKLDVLSTAECVRQAAEGLHHAHVAGLVHRDIKPGNLLVDQNGTVKILDLGLARFFEEGEQESLTVAHDEKVLGTADYLAPEQAIDSHLVDARADIYSLGCTVYYLMSGSPPFTEGTLAQRLMKHQTQPLPPITDRCPDVPASFVAILEKMTAKKQEDRYSSAAELSQAMLNWLQENQPQGLPDLSYLAGIEGTSPATNGSADENKAFKAWPVQGMREPQQAAAEEQASISSNIGFADETQTTPIPEKSDSSQKLQAPDNAEMDLDLGDLTDAVLKIGDDAPKVKEPEAKSGSTKRPDAARSANSPPSAPKTRVANPENKTRTSDSAKSRANADPQKSAGAQQKAKETPSQKARRKSGIVNQSPSGKAAQDKNRRAAQQARRRRQGGSTVEPVDDDVVEVYSEDDLLEADVLPEDVVEVIGDDDVVSVEPSRSGKLKRGRKSGRGKTTEVVEPEFEDYSEDDLLFSGEDDYSPYAQAPPTRKSGKGKGKGKGKKGPESKMPVILAGVFAVIGILLALTSGYFFTGDRYTRNSMFGELPRVTKPLADSQLTDKREVTVGIGGDYPTIQKALDFVRTSFRPKNGGDVFRIKVKGGMTYSDGIDIDNSDRMFPHHVQLLSEGDEPAILLGTSSSPVIELNDVERFLIKGFRVSGGNSSALVSLSGYLSGTRFEQIHFEEVYDEAVEGVGVIGSGGSDALAFERCRFDTVIDSAIGLHFEKEGRKIPNRVRIRNCRFDGPFKACIEVDDRISQLEIRQNIFNKSGTGVLINASEPLTGLTVSNNTFLDVGTGVSFTEVPNKDSRELSFRRNLFVSPSLSEIFISGNPDASVIKPMLQNNIGIEHNYTTRQGGFGKFNPFSTRGKTGVEANFVSTDPNSGQFLMPKHNSAHGYVQKPVNGDTNYIGAIKPASAPKKK